MKALSSILISAKEEGLISSFLVNGRGEEGVVLSHLLFIDDTIIFCNASEENMEYLSIHVV